MYPFPYRPPVVPGETAYVHNPISSPSLVRYPEPPAADQYRGEWSCFQSTSGVTGHDLVRLFIQFECRVEPVSVTSTTSPATFAPLVHMSWCAAEHISGPESLSKLRNPVSFSCYLNYLRYTVKLPNCLLETCLCPLGVQPGFCSVLKSFRLPRTFL